MDPTQQEIMHSLFSLDSSMENRGHLYAYNYPYGQYSYSYPYPYPAGHPPPTHMNIPSPSLGIPPSAHPIPLSTGNSVIPQVSQSSYSSGNHSIHSSLVDVRELPDNRLRVSSHVNSANCHAAEDIQNSPADSGTYGDSRYPVHMRPLAVEQRFVGDHRPIVDHPCLTLASSNLVDCPQPTDLSVQRTDSKFHSNVSHVPEDLKKPQDIKQTIDQCNVSLSADKLSANTNKVESNDANHFAGSVKYSRDICGRDSLASGMSVSSEEIELSSEELVHNARMSLANDLKMTTAAQESGTPVPVQRKVACVKEKEMYNSGMIPGSIPNHCSESHDISSENEQLYAGKSEVYKEKKLGLIDDVNTEIENQDYREKTTDSTYSIENQSSTDSEMKSPASDDMLSKVPLNSDNTNKENLMYPSTSSPSSSLGIAGHVLGDHNSNEVDRDFGKDSQESCVNLSNDSGVYIDKSEGNLEGFDTAEHILYNSVQDDNDKEVIDTRNEEEDILEDDDEEDEEDFDSEASTPEYPSPYIEFNDIAHGVFKNISNIAGPAKPFQCENCDATFTTKGNLKVHKRIHTGERPYECEDCGKTFSYCASYQSHKLIHSGHRPFKCEFCERAFFRSEHLERHRRRHTGERPFKCTECDATFAASDGLARHTRTHTGERPYNCEHCGMAFAYKSTFLRHKLVHSEGEFKCDDCGATFKDPVKLDKHVKKHNDPNYIPGEGKPNPQRTFEDGIWMNGCEFCEMKFKRKSDYYLHRRTHTGEKPYVCNICSSSFIRRTYLDIHMRIHTGERPYKCSDCEAAFKTRTALKFHNRIHTGERPYKCEVCDFAFAQKSAMKAHMRIHSGVKPFKCEECEASFRHSSSLTIHKRTHTGEKPYFCDQCGASFAQRPHLSLHKRSHFGIKPHTCDECNASFTKKDYLLAHKSKHAAGSAIKIEALVEAAGEHAFKCTECDMVFTHHSSLTVHMRKHTGERPFVCEDCGASFLYSSNLTTHRRKHTGERPYKCNHCESSFILKSYLTMHLRKHSGERPFKCDECGARFTQKTHLSTHRRIHTGECPYKCEECGEAFRDGANFWRHKKKHLVGEGAATVVKRKGRGRGRGRRGRGKERSSTEPLRRTSRVRRNIMKIEDLYDQFGVTDDGDPFQLKEEPGDTYNAEEDEPYIPINPMVEIKLEGDEEDGEHDSSDVELQGVCLELKMENGEEEMDDGAQEKINERNLREREPSILDDEEISSSQEKVP